MTIEEQIRLTASRYGVPPDLAVAVARQESSMNPAAVGDGGQAIGVFQLHEAAARDMGVNRYDLQGNIQGGVSYLAHQYRTFGSWPLALAAYNAGASNVAAGRGYAESILASLGWSDDSFIDAVFSPVNYAGTDDWEEGGPVLGRRIGGVSLGTLLLGAGVVLLVVFISQE